MKETLAGLAFVKFAKILKGGDIHTTLTVMLGFWHARGTNEKFCSLNKAVSSAHKARFQFW